VLSPVGRFAPDPPKERFSSLDPRAGARLRGSSVSGIFLIVCDDERAGLEVGDAIEANAVRGSPCLNDCSRPWPILLVHVVEGGWKRQRIHCRGCGVTWRRIWVE